MVVDQSDIATRARVMNSSMSHESHTSQWNSTW
jgi:hypothetical protein